MAITIFVPDELEAPLQRRAAVQRRSIEELALDILARALEAEEPVPTPEEVVAKIQATPPYPMSIRPAGGSPGQALSHAPTGPEFDPAAWQREWDAVEAEMKATTAAGEMSDGRGWELRPPISYGA